MSNCKPWKVTSIHFQLSKNTQLKENIHRVYLKPTGIFQVLLKLWIATKGPNLYWLYIPFSWGVGGGEKENCFFFFFIDWNAKNTMKEVSPNLPFPTHILFPLSFTQFQCPLYNVSPRKGKILQVENGSIRKGMEHASKTLTKYLSIQMKSPGHKLLSLLSKSSLDGSGLPMESKLQSKL